MRPQFEGQGKFFLLINTTRKSDIQVIEFLLIKT